MSTVRNSLHKRFIKRAFDIVVSLTLIVLTSPLLISVFIINCICTHGHPILLQERVGRAERVFHICKFRTLQVDAPTVKTSELEDISKYYTCIGKFLRKSSIDELPQLFNVLSGTMSIVGPRPIITKEKLLTYRRHLWNIDEVKPGITGKAQVMGRDDCTDDDKVYWDRWYVNNWCLKEDIKILLKTAKIVISRDGNTG